MDHKSGYKKVKHLEKETFSTLNKVIQRFKIKVGQRLYDLE